MREFKFRAWWKDTKRFLDGDEWYMTCSGAKHLHYSAYPYSDDDFIIEQYTGIKDGNGKEIYEGDIVNIQGTKYYVDFEYGGFWFNNDNRKWKANRPLTHFQEINDTEVIGNIHENPELLEEKQ